MAHLIFLLSTRFSLRQSHTYKKKLGGYLWFPFYVLPTRKRIPPRCPSTDSYIYFLARYLPCSCRHLFPPTNTVTSLPLSQTISYITVNHRLLPSPPLSSLSLFSPPPLSHAADDDDGRRALLPRRRLLLHLLVRRRHGRCGRVAARRGVRDDDDDAAVGSGGRRADDDDGAGGGRGGVRLRAQLPRVVSKPSAAAAARKRKSSAKPKASSSSLPTVRHHTPTTALHHFSDLH